MRQLVLRSELLRLVRLEVETQLPRPRTWLALGFAALVPVLITAAFAVGGTPSATGGVNETDFLLVATRSGLDMPLAALSTMAPFLLVVLVSLFGGEALSGEASSGRLRALLARPVSRGKLLAAKALVAVGLSVVACVEVSLAGLASGVAAFGWHRVVTPELVTYSEWASMERIALATVYVIVSLAGVGAFSLLVSTFTDSVIGAVSAGMAFAIVSEILDSIPALGSIRDGLPTHYMTAWGGLFLQPAETGPMITGLIVQAPYVLVCILVAWWWFRHKDVLS
jgi:ABC-2 type transport system permease protein